MHRCREWHHPTDAASVPNDRPLRDRVGGHHGKGIRRVRVGERLRAATARTALGGGDSDWSEHANRRPLHDPFRSATGASATTTLPMVSEAENQLSLTGAASMNRRDAESNCLEVHPGQPGSTPRSNRKRFRVLPNPEFPRTVIASSGDEQHSKTPFGTTKQWHSRSREQRGRQIQEYFH